MTLRNAIGQRLEVGTPVVVVSQGQGWTALAVGRVEKFSKQNLPQVRYLGDAGKHYGPDSRSSGEPGKLSPPLQRYERVFVITDEQYTDLAETKAIVDRAEAEFAVSQPSPDIDNYKTNNGGSSWGWEWKTLASRQEYQDAVDSHCAARKAHVNAAMNAAGKEPYYD